MADEQLRRQAAEIAGRLAGQVNRLARDIAERHLYVMPDYAGVPEDMRDLEIAATARFAVRQFVRSVQGTRVHDEDLNLYRERAAQRAEEGVELSTLLRSHVIGAEVIWDALCEAARPGEERALLHLARHQLRGLDRIVTSVTAAYQAEQGAILAEQREALRELARALLAGEPARALAARCGVALEPAYLVVNLRTATGAGAGSGWNASELDERRMLRRVRAGIERLVDGTPLMLADARGGHLLLPVAVTGKLDELRALLRDTGGVPVTAGAARSDGVADLPRAADRAVRIARIAESTGRPPGLYELDDVLLDYHLLGRPDSGEVLAGLLTPLDGHEGLLDTLRAYLDHDLDRRATARALGVHPNTVDNRLSRASRLLGVDLQTTRGIVLCATALAQRQGPS